MEQSPRQTDGPEIPQFIRNPGHQYRYSVHKSRHSFYSEPV
jgi:hypothetical protein